MSNPVQSDWKIFHDDDGWNVWKIDDKGKKVERKNDKPYRSRAAALPYLRALYSNMPKNESKAQLVLGAITFEADDDENPRFIRFHDAILARAETNANRDDLDSQGIEELASTIAGCAIDLEHDPQKNVGFYTAGRVDGDALRVDGVIWLDRCRAFGIDPAEIEDGTYKLSIEAEAETAECSVCHSVHNDVTSYCKHLKAKVIYGANRLLRGLRAIGGALTKRPAGSATGFSTIYVVASHQEEGDSTMDDELTPIVEVWINSIVGGISKREDVSDADKKRAEKEYGDVEYADEKNKKYPLDREHIHAAWSYINMPKNAAKYSPEELKAIKGKIKRAAKKYGMEISDDDEKSTSKSSVKETPIMADKPKEETPEEEKKESPAEEKNETEAGQLGNACDTSTLKAEDYTAMAQKVAEMATELEAKAVALKAAEDAKLTLEAKYAELESKVTSVQAALDEAQNTIKAHRLTELKTRLVGSVMDEAEFEKRQDELLTMPQLALELLARVKHESTDAKKPGDNRLAASESSPDNGRVRITL